MRVGALDVSILVDAEGSFATLAEAFPALSSREEWRLSMTGRFRRRGEGFSWSSLAKEGEAAVE
ncbi:MAG TPA: hypothetical protein VF963_01455 [Gaiellaceae bacterium]